MNQEFYTIAEVAHLLSVSYDTLRRWDKSGNLKSFRITSRSHRLYKKDDIERLRNKNNPITSGRSWILGSPQSTPDEWYCETRDRFQARLDSLRLILGKISGLSEIIPIIIAVSGEIGNNSFDHNLGSWQDIAGVFFGYELNTKQIIIVDRGQGILSTLRRVKPELKSDRDAMRSAFTEMISGRYPESRGNGLKFVRAMIGSYPLSLYFQSGNAEVYISGKKTNLAIKKAKVAVRGCLAIITF